MKKTVFLLLLFISTMQAQTVPKQSRLAITQNIKQNNATRIVVQDSITKELNWVLKSSLKPALQQVLVAGNTSTLPMNINLQDQPYSPIPTVALTASNIGYYDEYTGETTGDGIIASAPGIAIRAYSNNNTGSNNSVGVQAQGGFAGGVFSSDENAGIISSGFTEGVSGTGGYVGVVGTGGDFGVVGTGVYAGIQAFGGIVGVQANGTETGVQIIANDIGINLTSNNIGAVVNSSNTGIETSAQDTGLVAWGGYNYGIVSGSFNTGIYGNGDVIGVFAVSADTALVAKSTSPLGLAAKFDVDGSNTGLIADFRKNDVRQASITHDGKFIASQFLLNASNTAPASATAVGVAGEIRITASYLYYCVATNTWVRSALTTW